MGLFNWFSKKEVKTKGYSFTDEDREASAELREYKKEISRMKLERENELHKLRIEKQKLELQQEIDDLKSVYDDVEDFADKEEDTTSELIKMFAPLLMSKLNPVASVPNPQVNSENITPPQIKEQKQSLSDEQLQDIWKATPRLAKQFAKKSSDENIILLLQKQLPNVDDDTLARALKIIRND